MLKAKKSEENLGERMRFVHPLPRAPLHRTHILLMDVCSSLLNNASRLLSLKLAGKTAFEAEKYDDAVKRYTEALNVDPKNLAVRAVLFSNRAMAKMKVRRLFFLFPFFSFLLDNVDPVSLPSFSPASFLLTPRSPY